ncbi:hypothetical protein AB0B07_25050 [Streptomyces sioyaensis]|uniref:hypothetical protein n=1 Tax=Streptomyces sioyaensis TaxID=67364 RepID=UPI0034101EC8
MPYLFGFHWHRPIQARANSPMVCSGCCSVFRRDDLLAFGNFPERTIVEDMDYTCVPLGEWLCDRPGWCGKYAGQSRFWGRHGQVHACVPTDGVAARTSCL